MKEITLTRGKVAIVDDEDYDLLMQWRWCALSGRGKWYACLNVDSTHILMHRLLTEAPKDMLVDHRNGDSLDNRRENLRICTMSQNIANAKRRKDNTSGYKGVSYNKLRGKWIAYLNVNGKRHFLGYFDTPDEAAERYNEMAIHHFGEYTLLNKITR